MENVFKDFNAAGFEQWIFNENHRILDAQGAAYAAGDTEKAERLGVENLALARIMGAFWRFNKTAG